MTVFNPKILDASVRDVSACLSENDKADLLLFAVRKLNPDNGRIKTVIENAIQSCLNVATLSLESKAKARVVRARARLSNGGHLSGMEDLQAALIADPDNVEAKAMLHARTQTLDKLERISIEIWREVALFLPRRDLKTLLFVPHILSRVASQLLFRELDLHFTGGEGGYGGYGYGGGEDEGRHAQRTADILTRLIVDQKFANAVRTMRIYCSARRDRDGSMAFQTGMLTNVLPKLVNLKNIYLSAPSESIVPVLRILQTTSTRLHGLSLHSPDAPADLSFLELRNLSHFSYTTSGGTLSCITPFLSLSRASLSSLSLENIAHNSPSPHWTFPITYVSIRNLTSLNFTGHFTKDHGAGIMGEILRDGRQLESLSVSVSMNLNGTPVALPFLRNFAFTITSIGRRVVDRELFPSIADFLRGRRALKSLKLRVDGDEHTQGAVGFSAAVWGVLPSLEALRGVGFPGLASWLVPRSVRALNLFLDYAGHAIGRDPGVFLGSLRQGMPPDLRFIGLSELNLRHASVVVEQGFPTVRVVRVGQSYWTVHQRKYGSSYTTMGTHAAGTMLEMEMWPRRRVAYHVAEWLEWYGCEDALVRDHAAFPAWTMVL
ncbi:hypothetical protein FA13DRAFT_1754030 [Coprinellus micaceus]|uniref:Uncharacterized protein n=1 Tax=Coprinellus micaceus TaxID=71717 RepID=A0A4Y7TIK0_COPMI|nr:hypothetical protein FA13DRAFT_1754030 [Coprinellus micaceus]